MIVSPTTGTDRLVLNGQVAILLTTRHGGGWSTWNWDNGWALDMMFDPQIADIVAAGQEDWPAQAEVVAQIKYPDAYLGGIKNLQVQWIPQGTDFRITEYDGLETIEIRDRLDWITA